MEIKGTIKIKTYYGNHEFFLTVIVSFKLPGDIFNRKTERTLISMNNFRHRQTAYEDTYKECIKILKDDERIRQEAKTAMIEYFTGLYEGKETEDQIKTIIRLKEHINKSKLTVSVDINEKDL